MRTKVRAPAAVLGLLVLAVAYYAVSSGVFRGLLRKLERTGGPIVVAIIDTGVDPRSAPETSAAFAAHPDELPGNGKDDDSNGFVDDVLGWNFFDQNSDVSDVSGHGTEVARRVIRGCRGCVIVPIKISPHGGAIRAKDVAGATRYAVSRGARVINYSFATTEGSAELDQALKDAASAGAVLVTAAGTGVPNPFRPLALAELRPQSFEDAIVVGVAESPELSEMGGNFGSELDLVLVQPRGGPAGGSAGHKRGSSFFAGEVSGLIATFLAADPDVSSSVIRHWLRLATRVPGRFDPERFGFGLFDPALLETAHMGSDVEVRTFRDSRVGAGAQVEVSAAFDVQAIEAIWRCKGTNASPSEPKPNPLKKGRARVILDAPAGATIGDCRIKVRLSSRAGKMHEIEVTP